MRILRHHQEHPERRPRMVRFVHADCWLKMRKLWPELASVNIASSDLPDLVALRRAKCRIQEVFKANEFDRAQVEHDAVFNPATQEKERWTSDRATTHGR